MALSHPPVERAASTSSPYMDSSPLRSVALSPMHATRRLAREMATLRRLGTRRNPILPRSFERTSEMTTMSSSRPSNESTVSIFTERLNLRRPSACRSRSTCSAYIAMTAMLSSRGQRSSSRRTACAATRTSASLRSAPPGPLRSRPPRMPSVSTKCSATGNGLRVTYAYACTSAAFSSWPSYEAFDTYDAMSGCMRCWIFSKQRAASGTPPSQHCSNRLRLTRSSSPGSVSTMPYRASSSTGGSCLWSPTSASEVPRRSAGSASSDRALLASSRMTMSKFMSVMADVAAVAHVAK